MRDMRPRAVATYRKAFGVFLAGLPADPTVLDITTESIEDFQIRRGTKASSTISKELSAIRSYCRYCIKDGLRSDDPTLDIEWPKRRKRVPRALKQDELGRLEEILGQPAPVLDAKARRIWQRNTRIVLLLLYGGLRRAEVAGLRWAEIDLDAASAIVREATAKGGMERTIALHARIVANLRETPLGWRVGAVAGHPNGHCLSHKTIGAIFEQWLNGHGLRISAHRLRHSCATEMLRHGADVRDVQTQLGHADIRTTVGYLDVLTERQHSAIAKLPGRFGPQTSEPDTAA